jgi:hypothetical protein
MLSSYRIPAWIWIVAIVVNGILLVHNIERGNEDFMILNILCAVTCIIGILANRPQRL